VERRSTGGVANTGRRRLIQAMAAYPATEGQNSKRKCTQVTAKIRKQALVSCGATLESADCCHESIPSNRRFDLRASLLICAHLRFNFLRWQGPVSPMSGA
jgi:hypothetical protein